MRRLLAGAERVVASTLTCIDCARALARGVVTNRLSVADELAALKLLDIGSSCWVTLEMTGAAPPDSRMNPCVRSTRCTSRPLSCFTRHTGR